MPCIRPSIRLASYLCLAIATAACGSNDPRIVTCEADTNCNLVPSGQCVQSTEGANHCAYPETTCPSGFAWSELSGNLSGSCVRATFDVVYVSAWHFSISAPLVGGFAYIINTGPETLDLATLRVVSVTDDHAVAVVGATVSPPHVMLSPGAAAMSVVPILDPLVPERRITIAPPDDIYFWLDISGLSGPLQETVDIHATVTISLDDVEITLPTMTLNMESGLDPVVYAEAVSGARVAAFR